MSNKMIAVRLTSEQKERLEQIASARNSTVSDVIRDWIDETDTISADIDSISVPLKAKFQEVADIRGVSFEEMMDTCLQIGAFIDPKAWDRLKFNEARTTRHLTPAQQIVDLVNRHCRAPAVKWGRVKHLVGRLHKGKDSAGIGN